MNYILTSLKNLTLSNATPDNSEESIHVKVYFNNQEYNFNGRNNEETFKLYYNLLKQSDKVKIFNDYPTLVEIVGNDTKTYKFTTYKKLF